jgi:acyl-coenzyme A thioesterase PaaI-like protein
MDVNKGSTRFAPESPTEILDRFLIRPEPSSDDMTAAMSMPVAGHVNPLTGYPTVAALTLLIDTVGGLANHARRTAGEWTVTSELALELVPETARWASRPGAAPVIATGRARGSRATTSLATCTLTCDDRELGYATVRSYFVIANADHIAPKETLVPSPEISLGQLLSATSEQQALGGAAPALVQRHDPVLVNSLGIVNGGISSACLALAAAAAIDARADQPMQIGSFRVNFLHPLANANDIRYVAEVAHLGRRTAVATAQVSSTGGRPPLTATLTAYH